MPIYEYKCDECGSEFEVTQGMGDEPLTQCEACSGPVQRMISFTSFTLKGGGWYSDGYAGGPPSKKSKTETKKEGGNGGTEKKESVSTSTSTTTTLGKDK